MKTETTASIVASIAILLLTTVWMIIVLLLNGEMDALQLEAIERGHAQHNPVTGDWEWKEDTCNIE